MSLAADDNPDNLNFTEKAEHSWRAYLKSFKEEAWPMYEEYGFTFAEAFDAWTQNNLYNCLQRIEDKLDALN